MRGVGLESVDNDDMHMESCLLFDLRRGGEGGEPYGGAQMNALAGLKRLVYIGAPISLIMTQ
jgi:hypothetical protein